MMLATASLALAVLSVSFENDGVECSTLMAEQPHTDCWVELAGLGASAVAAEIHFEEVRSYSERIRITVISEDGEISTILESHTTIPVYPEVNDINGDGHDDLVIRVEGESANLEHEIFMGSADGFLENRIAVNVASISPLGDGLVRLRSRDSAAVSTVQIARFDGRILRSEAAVQLSYDPYDFPNADYDPETSGPVCRLVYGGEALGEAHYCALARN